MSGRQRSFHHLDTTSTVFQNFMDEIFRDMLHRFIIVYINDILIYSPIRSEHIHQVRQVFDHLLRHHLFLKLENCEFHQTIMQFLGYIISSEGIQMDQSKVEEVRNWPQPQTIKDLRCFLGFANFYCRFISNYSKHTAPLTSLLCNKPKMLKWTTSTVKAFQQLRATFCSAPTLLHPDPN